MSEDRQIQPASGNQLSTKRGFPVYRTNPSVPSSSRAMPTRTRRIEVPGGKAAMIVDNSTGEVKGLGGMGFWWEEEVDSSRFVKLFLEGNNGNGFEPAIRFVKEAQSNGFMADEVGNDASKLTQLKKSVRT